MSKSLNVMVLPIFEINFLPNNIPPYFWILFVTLFDPFGFPLQKPSKYKKNADMNKIARLKI